MAFNFKWSPLAADTSFYLRAQELLTAALNKSPKPPIIVDDIIVNELNLGDVPPELEVLEIGDLDVDRFRGVFKMVYKGNAFMTLKTRVQANPLNTYLSTKPSFASPQPLAAASGLTIPIQISLSEIRLDAVIILVYSSTKGVTLVFRNDPLQSLRVSSTFDAIPFVRDYLQKEIDRQLRTLLMDELPLILHRLSLRLFNKEFQENEGQNTNSQESDNEDGKIVDPLASPPQDPVDLAGNALDPNQIANLSLDPGSEMHALFSHKNLLHLGALTDSHRTLSLFTPGIRDAVFRAWAGPTERGEIRNANLGSMGKAPMPALSRSQSYTGGMGTKYAFSSMSNVSSPMTEYPPSSVLHRPALSTQSSTTNLSSLSSRTTKPGRKKKRRVVNLRKQAATATSDSNTFIHAGEDVGSISGEGSSTYSSATTTDSTPSTPLEISALRPHTPEREPGDADVGQTPPRLPVNSSITPHRLSQRERDLSASTTLNSSLSSLDDRTPRQSQYLPPRPATNINADTTLSSSSSSQQPRQRPSLRRQSITLQPSHLPTLTSSEKPISQLRHLDPSPFIEEEEKSEMGLDQGASIWMNKIAGEILRKVDEKRKEEDTKGVAAEGFWRRGSAEERGPPPAYGA